MKGQRKRDRQKKRWEDNIKEWTGMDFASSNRAAENKTRWKEIVANSFMVTRRPSKVNRNRINFLKFHQVIVQIPSWLPKYQDPMQMFP